MRGPYAKVAARNAALLERIRAIKSEHPFWGYRRVWAYLRYLDDLAVNQKRVRDKNQRSAGQAEPEAPGQAQSGHQQTEADASK